MKNKSLNMIFVLSILLLLSLLYVNCFCNEIKYKNITKKEVIEVNKIYKDNDNPYFCYGNKIKCKKINYKISGKVNSNKIGSYKIKYSSNYKNKKKEVIKEVIVKDTTKPVLKITGDFNNVCPNGKSEKLVILATDNYDGDITNKVNVLVNDNNIKYSVSDSSKNKTEKIINVKFNDNVKPVIKLLGEKIIYLPVNSKYNEPGFTASDNCDGNISKNVIVKNNVDFKKPGTYKVEYSVKDTYGNLVNEIRTIKVFAKNDYKPGIKKNKTIYLTFDDGPGRYTAHLLDILKKYNVKATFFVTGYNNNYNNLLTREYNEGHTVALHTYSHDYKKIYRSVDSFMEDLLLVEEKVKKYTGYDSKIVRFPGGSSNTISRRYKKGIMTELTNKLNELGYKYYDWTIMSGDAGNTTNTNKIIENVTKSISPDGHNMVLMHDIKGYSVDAVESIIKYGLSNGYTFAPITIDTQEVHQKVNN